VSGYERTQRYRAAHPDRHEAERRRNAARQRALVELSRAHPEEFQALYARELEVAGLARARAAQRDGEADG
jgi:hypothetical protein